MKTRIFKGRTGPAGELKFHDFPGMKEFAKKNPNKAFIFSFEIQEGTASELIKGYYLKKIVPDFQQAFKEKLGQRMSLAGVDETLRGFYPGAKVEVFINKGFETERLKTIDEFSNSEMVDFIDHLKMIASTEFDLFIEDPESI